MLRTPVREEQPVSGSWMEGLNPAQREAATAGGGPVLVVAGAGTGKTLTLACRVAHLIESGVPPQRILLLTFSRRASKEMLARAGRMSGEAAAGRVWGGTFHAVANRLLRAYGRALGLQPDFTVMDQGDVSDLMNLIRGDLGLAAGDRRFPRKETLAAIYSRTVNAGSKLSAVVEKDFPWCGREIQGIRAIFDGYGLRKREQNVLDYDDLLLFWLALVRGPIGNRVASLFDHILVDEYQDTNAMQGEIILQMRRGNTDIMVVGDDAQSIYSFRSATNRNILDFPSRFPGTRVVRLEQNYRSTGPILAASNAVIAFSKERHEKTLWSHKTGQRRPSLFTCLDEREQCEAVCRTILEHREEGVLLRQQAVLFRAAHHSDLLEVELSRRNIPFVKYGGLKFLEAAHVKDVLASLRILENPFDEVSWFRVLQLLDGVGPAGARGLMRGLGVRRESGGKPPSPLARLQEAPPTVPGSATEDFNRLRSALAECLSPGLPPASQIERLRHFLEPIIHRRYSSPRERLRDIEQLEHLASSSPSRGRFIAELTLDPPSSTAVLAGPPLLDEDYVVLSTIHSAKGCEWDVVHLIHAADGMIPSDLATGDDEEIEEERRLLYVAMTRARDALHVYFPLRYYRRPRGLEDPHAYAQLTRFIPPSVRDLFDEHVEGAVLLPDPAAMGEIRAGEAAGEVDAFLSNLWRG
jgi:DNA helicase-2/ATP-dependent DNA helicase PcrA